MATTTVKTTYSLDIETVRTLEEIAHRWKVSKSEALRRAIRTAAKQQPPGVKGALQALDELQGALRLSTEARRRWERRARAERRASSLRLESR